MTDKQCNRCGKVNPAEIHTCTPQPEPEPVGEIIESHGLVGVSIPNMPTVGTKLYTDPPQRKWQGLTDDEAKKTFEAHNCTISADLAGILARAIEAKLKEKNT